MQGILKRTTDEYEKNVYVKNEDFNSLRAVKDELESLLSDWEKRGITRRIQVQFDFDPMNFM